jgi:transcriptional regulator with GAF, ATPase, and Fis domain
MATEKDERIRKVYSTAAWWVEIEDEAARRGLYRGDKPNVSKCIVQLCEEARVAAGPEVASLAARAVTLPKGTRQKIRAALIITEGVVSKAAPLLGTSDRDLRRAIEVLDMKKEIARTWKGAAS